MNFTRSVKCVVHTHIHTVTHTTLSLSLSLTHTHTYTQEYTTQVEKLHNQAPQIESQIHGFKSELVKKATSLKTVWDKFLQRVDNRRKILLLTSGFYDNTAKVHAHVCCSVSVYVFYHIYVSCLFIMLSFTADNNSCTEPWKKWQLY